MESSSYLKLKTQILNEIHTNQYEHKENYIKFTYFFILYAVLGVVLGGLTDLISKKVRNNSTSKLKCAGILLIQIFAIGSIFFLLMKIKFKSGIAFDDWMMATWSGFIFSLTFFTSQKSLGDLIQIIFNS